METTPKFKATADYLDLRSEPQRLHLDLPLRQVDSVVTKVAAMLRPYGCYQPRRGERDAELRVLDGHLYQQPRTNAGEPAVPGSALTQTLIRSHFGTADTAEAAERLIHQGVSRLIAIDGEIWQQVDEPVLVVEEHAYLGCDIKIREAVPASAALWQVFALTEGAAAQATALERFAGSFPRGAGVEILIPEAFTADTSGQRFADARSKAEAEAAKVVEMLSEFNSDTLMQAAKVLETAARHLRLAE